MKILRYVVLALLVAALAAGLLWIAAQNATILMRLPGREIEVPGVAAAIALLVGTAVLYGLVALVVWLWTLPGKIARARREANQKKGLDAIASGWAALEAGDPAEARKHANKASGLAPDQKLGRLLAARAALSAGDAAGAERLFGEIVDVPALAVAARKGLAEAALARGADTAAEAHATAALAAGKSAVWPASFLLARKVAAGDWDGALTALVDAEKRGAVSQKVAQRKRAEPCRRQRQGAGDGPARRQARPRLRAGLRAGGQPAGRVRQGLGCGRPDRERLGAGAAPGAGARLP